MTQQFPSRAMAIIAHPDDAEFLCGGTIAKWCGAGTKLSYLILTNGNKGSDDPAMSTEKLAHIRRQEQQAAAELMGIEEILYLDQPDGELQHTLTIRQQVVTEIRRYRPEVVITFDPSRYFIDHRYVNHADHRVAGEIAVDAIYPAARNRMYHPELLAQGLEPHPVKDIFLILSEQPNRWVNIDDVIETKIQAILCHASQIQEPDGVAERVKQRDRAVDQYGREVFREGFKVISIG